MIRNGSIGRFQDARCSAKVDCAAAGAANAINSTATPVRQIIFVSVFRAGPGESGRAPPGGQPSFSRGWSYATDGGRPGRRRSRRGAERRAGSPARGRGGGGGGPAPCT